MSVFDGICKPENPEFKYYYPTQDLVTGPDIIFFWVIRMIISGYEFTGKEPFKNIYFTGLVRDKKRQKMSKDRKIGRRIIARWYSQKLRIAN